MFNVARFTCSVAAEHRRQAPPPHCTERKTAASRPPTDPTKMPGMLAAQFTALSLSQSPSPQSSLRLAIRPSLAARARFVAPRTAASAAAVSAKPAAVSSPLIEDRTVVRIGLPSKGRMAEQTLSLLKSCQLSVRQLNPRQYTADIPLIPNLEVWFQRPKDIVRKLQSGDLDLGVVGFDIVSEYGNGNEDLVVVHDALEFGHCRLSLAVPKEGIFENIHTMEDLLKMTEWTEERPLRVVTGFGYRLSRLIHVANFLPPVKMGMADAIVDLVSSGTTLRENNLKEIDGGVVLESQATLVASRKSLHKRKGVLEVTHELLERLEAHLRATAELMVTANMRGNSAEEVAERVLSQTSIWGLQGPTVSPVYRRRDGKVDVEYYAINVVVPQKLLYKSIQQLRSIGGSGVLVTKLTYIFDEETPRWRNLLSELGL
ncbi:ATP phosphoribosyltransferase 2 chloroplastic [Zea mays]|uniref:ATP phosphoribosyltransferase n=1 Tax=Zea mays TaxID=4577 RepID=A0A1D6I6V1_MAIZE|nr:ATP phosphoribosyltransferase 2 chloroplastic [Zea mays]